MNEQKLRKEMAMHAKFLFDCWDTCGGSGNISI